MPRKSKSEFNTATKYRELLSAMQNAIDNMIAEVKRPIDGELNGSQRKSELQSVKLTAMDCRELISTYRKIESELKELEESGDIKEERDFGSGFAERNAS